MQLIDTESLFHAVQMNQVFSDGKTFVDCTPIIEMDAIETIYQNEKEKQNFDLVDFIHTYFLLPETKEITYQNDNRIEIEQHIKQLWSVLTRQPDEAANTLLPLSHPYVVPGGRFREVYYWDSYFTMLGLKESGEFALMQNVVDNFAELIDAFGYVPNGNRSYYLGRSQPPFFALMVSLLSEVKGDYILAKYLPQLEDEWVFWNQGKLDDVNKGCDRKLVKLSDTDFQLRYFDENNTPRPESYREDVELAHQATTPPQEVFQHLRAAAESGWDFSHRWFLQKDDFASIHTTDILPVDLNCLNFYLTNLLATLYADKKDKNSVGKAKLFQHLAAEMKENIQTYYWNEAIGFFTDYDFKREKKRDILTLAGVFPLFFGLATQQQAESVARIIETEFLKAGGVTTTLFNSGQQWDAPNGWAPLQWTTYKGLQRYGFNELANEIKQRWLNTCEKVYQNTGKLTEKYDVWQQNAAASGGEYPNQDGFGWTNGVYLAMKNDLNS